MVIFQIESTLQNFNKRQKKKKTSFDLRIQSGRFSCILILTDDLLLLSLSFDHIRVLRVYEKRVTMKIDATILTFYTSKNIQFMCELSLINKWRFLINLCQKKLWFGSFFRVGDRTSSLKITCLWSTIQTGSF